MRKYLLIVLFCVCFCCGMIAVSACNGAVSVSGVSFKDNAIELSVGEEYQLEYTFLPENVIDCSVTFYTSDENIATVSEDGVVFAVSCGEANITIVTDDGNFSDICFVTVTENGGNDSDRKDDEEEEQQNAETENDGQDNEETGDQDPTTGDNQDAYDAENTEYNEDEESNNDETENDKYNDKDEDGDNNDEEENDGTSAYTVTFIADGETIAVCEFTEDNLFIEEPELPEKEGYTVEWESYAVAAESITVNAVYTPIWYELTFIANGSVVDVISFTIESESIDEPNVPTVIGYDGKWESYSLKCKDITVSAVYTIINYTITYLNTKGADNANPDSYNVEQPFVIENLTAEGYIFEGWYMNEEKITSINGRYGDLTLTAKWSLIEYEIRFIDGNYNLVATVYYDVENSEITFPDVPVKEGYNVTWGSFELTYDNEPVYVYAIYTKIEE